jgi:propanediol dehydratase large subunit
MSSPSVDYQSVLQDLKARRDRMNTAIEGINAAIKAVEHIIGELQPGPVVIQQASIATADSGNNGSDVYRKMTLKDAAIHLLSAQGPSKTTLDIIKGLKDGGVKSKSKNLYTTLYNTLTGETKRENGKVVRNADKSWSLRVVEQQS